MKLFLIALLLNFILNKENSIPKEFSFLESNAKPDNVSAKTETQILQEKFLDNIKSSSNKLIKKDYENKDNKEKVVETEKIDKKLKQRNVRFKSIENKDKQEKEDENEDENDEKDEKNENDDDDEDQDSEDDDEKTTVNFIFLDKDKNDDYDRNENEDDIDD